MTFRLNRHGRENYDQKIQTDPPILAWEASFDGGATWAAGEALAASGDPDWYRWLVAGDLAELGTADARLFATGDRDLIPIARAVANPEIIVRNLEPIRVE